MCLYDVNTVRSDNYHRNSEYKLPFNFVSVSLNLDLFQLKINLSIYACVYEILIFGLYRLSRNGISPLLLIFNIRADYNINIIYIIQLFLLYFLYNHTLLENLKICVTPYWFSTLNNSVILCSQVQALLLFCVSVVFMITKFTFEPIGDHQIHH